jgi:hypothetical protein
VPIRVPAVSPQVRLSKRRSAGELAALDSHTHRAKTGNMRSRLIPDDVRQYGPRSSAEVRTTLLELTRDFVLGACRTPGVLRVAVLGSLLTPKPRPKDADVLVTIADAIALDALARLGRRLQGTAQAKLNSGADILPRRCAWSLPGPGLPLSRVSPARALSRPPLWRDRAPR